MTHTYVILDISEAAYNEIATKLRAAEYHHVFHGEGSAMVIDMQGIALQMEEKKASPSLVHDMPTSIMESELHARP